MKPEKTGKEQDGPGVRISLDKAVLGELKGRIASGRFAKGVSGNPAGRPRGARGKRTEFLDDLLGDDGSTIVGKLVEEAKAGRPWAVRLAIERLLPLRMDRRVEMTLPKVDTAASVNAAVAEVIRLAAGGELTVDDAGSFLRLIDQQRKAIETNDLAVRLELLETQQKNPEGEWES